MSVILRVDEKVGHVISLLGENYSDKEFLDKFIEIYPDDYKKCWRRFNEEEAHTKPGKRHPMQHPDKYIKKRFEILSKQKKDMKINLIKFLMGLVALLIFAPQAHAADFYEGGLYYKILSEQERTVGVAYPTNTSAINEYKKECKGDIEIPKKIIYKGNTYTVIQIGNSAFKGCSDMTSVTIPNSVTEISQNAFADCSSLEGIEIGNSNSSYSSRDGVLYTKDFSILQSYPEGKGGSFTIPNSVIIIGNGAFYYCKNLTSVTIPNSVTSIGDDAFSYCTGLTSVTIPNSVTIIGNYAFFFCTSLTSVTIPNSVTTIGNYAFRACSGLTSVTIPNSVITIGWSAFYNCSGLTSVTISNSVTTIEWQTFLNCSGLTSVTIPNSVTEIGGSAFRGCSGLTSVTIPNSVTEIDSDAFRGCSGLTSVTIPNSVTTIDDCAFYGCSGLTSVTIPGSVTKIGKDAFRDCDAIRKIYCHWEEPIKYDGTFTNEILKEAILYVPKGCVSAYEKVDPWRNFWNIEEASYSGITEISADGLNISVTDGVINIDCVGSETLVEVFDIAGKTVYRGYGHTVTGLSNGIYIVKVGSQTRKIRI